MMKQWRFATKPHIVADSGFGSIPLLKEIISWGGSGTLSVPSNETGFLGKFLGYNLPLESGELQ